MKSFVILLIAAVILVTLSCATQRSESRCHYRTKQYIAHVAEIEGNTVMFDIEGLKWAYSMKGLRNGAYGPPLSRDLRLRKNMVYVVTKKELLKGNCKAELIESITPR